MSAKTVSVMRVRALEDDGWRVLCLSGRGVDRQRGDSGLGRTVVALPDTALQTGAGGGVDDARVDRAAGLGVRAPIGRGVAHGREVPLEMHPDDGVPLLLGQVDQHPVADDAGIVDQHVQAPEGLHGLTDQALGAGPVGDVVAVDHGLSAEFQDLLDDLRGRGIGTAAAVQLRSQVVDHHVGPGLGEGQRVGAADATAGSGHDDSAPGTDPLVVRHVLALVSVVLCCDWSAGYRVGSAPSDADSLAVAAARNAGRSPPPCASSADPLT